MGVPAVLDQLMRLPDGIDPDDTFDAELLPDGTLRDKTSSDRRYKATCINCGRPIERVSTSFLTPSGSPGRMVTPWFHPDLVDLGAFGDQCDGDDDDATAWPAPGES